MTNEKWNSFMLSGKISDYLEYKKSQQISSKVGDTFGNSDAKRNSPKGISGR